MIPRRLRLHNFLSYRDCTLDFAGLHIAALSGRNGDGKSALLDAMTWALWGEARGRIEDDRILLGAHEMLVSFEFEVDGERFEVVRKRTRGKGAGALDLFHLGPEGFKTTRTGATTRETQAYITHVVRMDFVTFVNSAFIAQGRSNEFTSKQPADRKEVLRKVLGLERYELLADRANDRKKDAATRARELDRNLGQAREEAARLPEVEAAITVAAVERQELEPALAETGRRVAELQQAHIEYDRQERDAADAGRALAGSERAIQVSRETIAALERQAEGLADLLGRASAIEARYAELLTVRAEESAAAAKFAGCRQHEQAAAVAERELATARSALEMRATTTREQLDAVTRLAGEAAALRAREAALSGRRTQLAGLQQDVETARRDESELQAKSAGFAAEAEQLRTRAAELKAKETQLEGAAECPVCRAPLGEAEAARVRADYAVERRAMGERYRTAMAEAQQCQEKARSAREAAGRLQEDLAAAERDLQREAREIAGELATAAQAEARLPVLLAEIEDVLAALREERYAPGAREAAAAAKAALAAIAYDPAVHQALRERLHALATAGEDAIALSRARASAEGLDERAARERDILAERVAAHDAHEGRMAAARAALAAIPDVPARLAAAERDAASLRQRHDALTLQIGRLQQQRDTLHALVAKIETTGDEVAALKDEERAYADLSGAFGRNGVQAMLMEQSLPRLELIANELLDRMTDGRIQVTLATQRQTAAGQTKETLDIRISDDLGTRDYEMYSGGEAFRVDFALRIALARLLAERAGASLPTLIVDEGFASQDQDGIDRLVEALTLISSEFRLILVVTHIEELRERFERRIEVTKTLRDGSLARVV